MIRPRVILRVAACCVIAAVTFCSAVAKGQEAGPGPAVAAVAPAELTATPAQRPPTPAPAAPDLKVALPVVSIGSNVPTSEEAGEEAISEPWGYSPYRVLIWTVSDDPTVTAKSLEHPLRKYLDLDFAALWRIDVADAPTAIHTAAIRNLGSLNYDLITASDPVIAVKRDHPEAVRIRVAFNVGTLVQTVLGTQGRIDEVKRRAAAIGNETIDGVAPRLKAIDGDEVAVHALWEDEKTEAVLVSRGMALTLDDPEAKLVVPPIDGLVGKAVDSYDKIFIVRINRDSTPNEVAAVELDTLMRHFGPIAREWSSDTQDLPATVGRAVTRAFAPVVRIDNAGQSDAVGTIRAGRLILDKKNSPANIRVGDVLEPMTRKNDRNGKPILIGPIDWAFLFVVEPEIAALCTVEDVGIQVGDMVINIAGTTIEYPQRIQQVIDKHQVGEKVPVEVERGGAIQKMSLEVKDSSPLQPQYFGFTAGVRRGEVIVTGVIDDSPAEGKLRVADVIVSVGDIKVSSAVDLGRTVIANKPNKPIKFVIKRDESRQEVVLQPTETSARHRREDPSVVMDYHSGRAGGLQGRKNNRTFRMALKARPFGEQTLVRLHAKGDPDFPLIGYEVYQKELMSKNMTFVGRTDWNGRLYVKRTEDPLRLFYVKNGGAVLARLPTVPGLTEIEVADIGSDDMRLQAEAYIRGVQNAIVDLVAIRELFKARIHLRLSTGKPGDMEKAEELLEALRTQPSNERLATDMGKKQDMFVKAIGRNANQRAKVDQMFKITRDLLAKHINPKLVNELELDVIAARKNGGKLPAKPEESGEE